MSIAHEYDDEFLSTAQASAALGVSITTVKRWVDDAILPAHRTAGGHRKLLRADVLRMIRDGSLAAQDASKLLPVNVEALAVRFAAAMKACDVDGVPEILRAAYLGGLPVETLADRVIAPGMSLLGELWERGSVDVSHEHRFSLAVQAALFELKASLKGKAGRGPVALGGSPEGDYSVLPNLLAEMALLDRGWRVVNLGPHTPFEALGSSLAEHQPKLVWISVGHIADVEKFEAGYRAFYEQCKQRRTMVALGGGALKDDLRRRLPYTTFGDGLSHLVEFANTLYEAPKRPKRGRPPHSEQ